MDVAVVLSIVLLAAAVVAAAALIGVALRAPDPGAASWRRSTPPGHDHPEPRVRLRSRLLFAERSFDAITLDCTLVDVDTPVATDLTAARGLPFTIRLRCPDTAWFAGRIEEMFTDWADEGRELDLEITPERGRVRTTVASGGSSVHLELAGAAGLGSGLTA